jgi:hypothetical protein
MRALFLALGASRTRAVAAESANVVAAGGQAAVLVDHLKRWRRVSLDPAVTVIDLSRLEARHLPMRMERLLVYGIPRRVFLAIGRGPLEPWGRRAVRAYKRRVADRVHGRLFLPVYRRLWGAARYRLLERQIRSSSPAFDLFVVTDPVSIVYGARLHAACGGPRGAPVISFGLDYAAPAARTASLASHD